MRATDVSEVMALPSNPASRVVERGNPNIELQAAQRKDHHDAALKEFHVFLDELSENMEAKVLACSRQVRMEVEALAQQLSVVRTRLEDDALLALEDRVSIEHERSTIDHFCAKRAAALQAFEDTLEDIEKERAETFTSKLRGLVAVLVRCAHELEDGIERIVEAEAFELNSVLTSNRLARAELLASMRKQDIQVRHDAVEGWEKALQRWRVLQHDRAVQELIGELSSDVFVRPLSREVCLESIRLGQEKRQRYRCKLFHRLAELDERTLTSEAVEAVRNELAQLSSAEAQSTQDACKQLTEHRIASMEEMVEKREQLRENLHTIGAMVPEPELKKLGAEIMEYMQDQNLAELYARSGGLKPEIGALAQELSRMDLMYDKNLADTAKRVNRIVCGFGLGAVLENEGKEGLMEELRAMLGRIGSLSRADILLLLPSLRQQALELCEVQGMDPLLCSLLQESAGEIQTVMQTAEDRQRSYNTQTALSKVSRASAHSAVSRATRMTVMSKGTTATESSRRTSRPQSSEAEEIVVLDRVTLRAIRRRMEMLLRTSEIPHGMQAKFKTIVVALAQQGCCNASVDAIVSAQCDGVIAQRDAEQTSLVVAVIKSLEAQAAFLDGFLAKLCAFYTDVAVALAEHRRAERLTDDRYEEQMGELKGALERAVQAAEKQISATCTRLRRASNRVELNDEYHKTIEELEGLEVLYRRYHSCACYTADTYPLHVARDAHGFLKVLCEKFALSPGPTHPLLVKHLEIIESTVASNAALLKSDATLTSKQASEGGAGLHVDVESTSALLAHSDGFYSIEELRGRDQPGAQLISDVNIAYKVLRTAAQLVDGMKYGDTNFSVAGGGTSKVFDARRASPRALTNIQQGLQPWLTASIAPVQLSELSSSDREAWLERLLAVFIELPDDTMVTLSPEDKANYVMTQQLVQTTVHERFRAQCLAQRLPPSDGKRTCLLLVDVDPTEVASTLESLAKHLLMAIEHSWGERIKQTEASNKIRKAELAMELEKQLRLHEPRRGHADTAFRQVRERELLAHEQRLQRHLALVETRVRALEEEFQQALRAGKGRSDAFVRELGALKAQLSLMTSLAGLQGLELRCKILAENFRTECIATNTALQAFVQDEPEKLKALGQDMLRACRPFDEGGEYGDSEIPAVTERVRVSEEVALAEGQARQAGVQALLEQQTQALAALQDFNEKYKAHLQELSLSEGLGQKYGAPRRNAQECIRSEMARDERAAAKIDELLALLEFECAEAMRCWRYCYDEVQPVSAKVQGLCSSDRAAVSLPSIQHSYCQLSSQVKRLMLSIRCAVHSRAEYLGALKAPGVVKYTQSVPWPALRAVLRSDDRADSTQLCEAPHADSEEHFYTHSTLESCVARTEAVCKNETRELYTKESKEQLLSATGGVPPTLKQWLDDMREKLLGVGPGSHRGKSWRRLRAQMRRWEDCLWKNSKETPDTRLEAPAACLRDVFACARSRALTARVDMETRFARSLKAWELGRVKHERLLRPQLGTMPEELNQLCKREAERSAELKEAIVQVRMSSLKLELEHAEAFVDELRVTATGLCVLLDTSLFLDDVLEAPGETNDLHARRKGFKHLRKLQRIREDCEAKHEPPPSDVSGRPPLRRRWHPLALEQLLTAAEEADAATAVLQSTEVVAVPIVASRPKSGAKSKAKIQNGAEAAEAPATILSAMRTWSVKTCRDSELETYLTPAHRALMRERDQACAAYTQDALSSIQMIIKTYAHALAQEESWQERWRRQLATLQRGDIA